MDQTSRIAVCSRSFSQNAVLRAELSKQFSQIRFNESGVQLQGNDLIEFLKGADRAIVALEEMNDSVLSQLPELKVIGKYGVGLDKIDFQSLQKHGVKMGWTPGVNAPAVAELTLAMALTIVRNIHTSHALLKAQGWKQIQGKQLSSMTYGILGCGHVGKSLAKLLQPFGCKILVCDIKSQADFYHTYSLKEVSLSDLISQSDVLSIHIPKNERTKNILNREQLSSMKKGSYLINTARGGLIDEVAVLEFLQSGQLAGAAFDVFDQEPPTSSDLISHPNCYSTTHIGGSSQEAILAMGRAAILGLSQYRDAMTYEEYK